MKPRGLASARGPLVRAAFAGTFALLLAGAPALATGGLTSVSGYAYGESVDVTLIGAIHVTSGPLPQAGPIPSTGGSASNSALSACVGTACGVLSAGLLSVASNGTTGPTGSVSSTASVATVNALAGLVTGTLVASRCAVDPGGATSGSSTLTTVQVNGITVASNPGPNTQLVLLDAGNVAVGHVILNEQAYDSGTNTLTVNAIHIKLDVANNSIGSGDIVISHVECDALPSGPAPVIPEAPLPVLLPVTALLILGGGRIVALALKSAPTGR